MNLITPVIVILLLASFTTPIVAADDLCQVTTPDGTVSFIPCCNITEYSANPSRCGYRVVNVIGTSENSWEDAANQAIAAASKSFDNIISAEVIKLDMEVNDGKVAAYRARVTLSFKYEP